MPNRLNPSWKPVLLIIAASLALLINACGVKSAPEEAPTLKPPTVDIVKAHGQNGRVTLSWATPEAVDPSMAVAGFSLYRKGWPPGVTHDAQAQTLLLADIKVPAEDQPQMLNYTDTAIKAGDRYEYYLFTYNTAKTLGAPYKVGPFVATFPNQTVLGFSVQPHDGTAIISWLPFTAPQPTVVPGQPEPAAPTKPSIYVNIYRAEGKEGPYGTKPINPEPLTGGSFRDDTVQPGLVARYKARAATEVEGVILEGLFSEEKMVTVIDKTPPAAPTVAWVKPLADGVRLRWTGLENPGTLGFHVERRGDQESETQYVDVSNLITVDEFTDRTLKEPGTYIYRVVARDRAGNLAYSQEQTAIYPAPNAAPAEPTAEPATEAGEPAATPEVAPEPKEDISTDSLNVPQETTEPAAPAEPAK